MKISVAVQKLHKKALQARGLAYAPYSKFKVGAALKTVKGRVIGGCNVENASYGATICAERVALLKAVSEGEDRFTDILVVTDTPHPAFPCALCLQMMAEFFQPDARIWVANAKKVHSVHLFSELLPKPFGPRQLKDAK